MARPPISQVILTDTLTMSECLPTANYKGAYWLYDKTQGMNLAMGANTPEDAFVMALTYYQKRLIEVEQKYANLNSKVVNFVSQFIDEDSTIVNI